MSTVSITSSKWWPSAILLQPAPARSGKGSRGACGRTGNTAIARRGGGLEEPVFHHGDRQAQQRGVPLNLRAVLRAVARIHHEIDELEGPIREPLQQLHALCQQHGVLPPEMHTATRSPSGACRIPSARAQTAPRSPCGTFSGCSTPPSSAVPPKPVPLPSPRGRGAFSLILSIFRLFVHPAAAGKKRRRPENQAAAGMHHCCCGFKISSQRVLSLR